MDQIMKDSEPIKKPLHFKKSKTFSLSTVNQRKDDYMNHSENSEGSDKSPTFTKIKNLTNE